jgi:hypothetical protein
MSEPLAADDIGLPSCWLFFEIQVWYAPHYEAKLSISLLLCSVSFLGAMETLIVDLTTNFY